MHSSNFTQDISGPPLQSHLQEIALELCDKTVQLTDRFSKEHYMAFHQIKRSVFSYSFYVE